MAEREGVLQVLHDFGFGLQLGGPVGVLLDGLRVDRFPHERTEKQMIGVADVLHLFGKRAHAFKLAVGGREGVLVFGHSLGGGNDFLLDNPIIHVEDGRGGGRLLLGRCAALGVDGGGSDGCAKQDKRYAEVLHRTLLKC